MSQRRSALFASLTDTTYDLLIVGGGITGAGIVRDAAGRGLRCLLVDKGDFASGTSSKSGKLIHGGLRYLKYRQWRLVFEACRERWLLQTRIAPHLVRPIRFVVPCYASSRAPRWLLALGLLMYELLALGRNRGHFRILSPRRLSELEPELDRNDCRGGVSYSDCAALDFRLVIDTLKSAERDGAHLINYAEIEHLEKTASGYMATVRDTLSSEPHMIRSQCVINAAGPWADEVQARTGASQRFGLKLAIGIHLVVSRTRLPARETTALEIPQDGRMIYVVPWDQNVLIGTTDTFYAGDKDALPITADAVEYLLAGVNRYFPRAALTPADVLASFVGARPLLGGDGGESEDAVSRDYEIVCSGPGQWAITGGKLTTYRAMAQDLVDRLVRKEFPNRRMPPCSTTKPLASAVEPFPVNASAALLELWQRYGSEALSIESMIRESPELDERIDDRAPFFWAEVVYALENEYVERIDDLVDRRLGAFLLAPGVDLREKIERWLRLRQESGLINCELAESRP
jgi:glycerol-3-phosphate dehydrogenase